MRTMNYEEALEFAKEKGNNCAIYELNTKNHQFEYIGSGGDESINEILMNNVYLYEGNVVCSSLPYCYVNNLIEVQNDNEEAIDLEQLFEVPEDPWIECPACGEKFSNVNELAKHQYETGHESIDPGAIKNHFCHEICYCIAELKKIMKNAANKKCENSSDCKNIVKDINDSIAKLDKAVLECEHTS